MINDTEFLLILYCCGKSIVIGIMIMGIGILRNLNKWKKENDN